LSSAGCGGLWLERVPVQVRAGGSATVEVRARVETRTVGGVSVVEQAPGQGFVVTGGTRSSAPVYLAGFEAPPASTTEARVDARAQAAPTTAGVAPDRRAVGPVAPAPTVIEHAQSEVVVGEPTVVRSSGTDVVVGEPTVVGSSSHAEAQGRASIDARVEVDLEARAAVPRDGVWALDGRRTALTALTGPGVQVDGVRVHLSDLEALMDLGLAPAPSTRLATDGALEAWAEVEHEALPTSGGETHVVVRLRAPEPAAVPRGRLRVHLVIDRSSSMQRTWDRVIAAARVLVERLAPEDELHVVAYGTDAFEAFPLGRVGDRQAALAALDRIGVGGGTHIEAGLDLAYRASARADGSARSLVILLSDGVPNHGAFEPADFASMVGRARTRGTTTSVIGLGTEFDERLLRTIARHGRGAYHVSANLDALADGLVRELEAHARAAARELSVRVALPEGVELVGPVQGEAEVNGREVVLTTPSLDAGEERRIVLRVRVAPGSRARAAAHVSVAYRSGLDGRSVSASRTLELSFGPRAVVRAEGPVGAALVDGQLSSALDAAGRAIVAGDAATAASTLEEHARWMEGRVELRQSEALQARARVVRRLGRAVGALVPDAGHAQRRQVGQALGALAARFAR
jgi:Ca-activated chloride channel family protein